MQVRNRTSFKWWGFFLFQVGPNIGVDCHKSDWLCARRAHWILSWGLYPPLQPTVVPFIIWSLISADLFPGRCVSLDYLITFTCQYLSFSVWTILNSHHFGNSEIIWELKNSSVGPFSEQLSKMLPGGQPKHTRDDWLFPELSWRLSTQ